MREVQGKRKELEGKTADAGSQSETGRYKVSDMAGVELLQGGCGLSCPPALPLAVFRVMQEEGLSSGEVALQQVQPLSLCCALLQQGHGLAHQSPLLCSPSRGPRTAADRSDSSRVPCSGAVDVQELCRWPREASD